MRRMTVNFLKTLFGRDKIKGTFMLMELLGKVLYLFKRIYPSINLDGSASTMAFSAMEFMLNAEIYFEHCCPRGGKSFFNKNRGEFLKHFNYEAAIKKVERGDRMMLLYHPLATFDRKLSANSVIGDFHSFEYACPEVTDDQKDQDAKDSALVTINLKISNNGIISLPITGMVYFGKWCYGKFDIVI